MKVRFADRRGVEFVGRDGRAYRSIRGGLIRLAARVGTGMILLLALTSLGMREFGCVAALRAEEFDWRLRPRFSPPPVPADNPMSAEKVALGRYLFYDRQLSVNGEQSCATCHRQELAFTDGLARAKGTTGEFHPRSSMSLVNIAYAPALTWADPTLDDLAPQALAPMFGTDPVELGLKGHERELLLRLQEVPVYRDLFPKAFSGPAFPFTVENVTKALAAFERTIISTRSPYDRYRYDGVEDAISAAAKRGERLFFSGEKAGCFQCHGGWNFSGPVRYAGGPEVEPEFHNTGLREVYKAPNNGIERHTGLPGDNGRFKAPTLRNIALTAPYMHDGSIGTLEAVLDHYAGGGRVSANKSVAMRPHALTAQERADLIEFLKALTDEDLARDPRWSDPWKAKP